MLPRLYGHLISRTPGPLVVTPSAPEPAFAVNALQRSRADAYATSQVRRTHRADIPDHLARPANSPQTVFQKVRCRLIQTK